MFQSFIQQAKLATTAVVSRYTGRALVAFLFLVAAGFGLAAIAIMLAEAFGVLTAMAALAGAFALIGVVAYLFVLANDRHHEAMVRHSTADNTAMMTTLAAAAPVALAGGLRLLGRAPLLLAAVAVGGYFLTGGLRTSASNRGQRTGSRTGT